MVDHVVILDGVRTPFGKFRGALSELRGVELGVAAVSELIRRVPETKHADGVLLAEIVQAGQGQNPARQAAVQAGIELTTPAATLNNVCLAGLASVADAARRIQAGEGKLYVTGGFESMTNAPHAAAIRSGIPLGKASFIDTVMHDGLWCSLSDQSMGVLSDEKNETLEITRQEQDEYAALSQQRAERARAEGRLATEIVPVDVGKEKVHEDEGIRPGTAASVLEKLRPAFRKNGTITAGNASQMTDGASVGLVTTESYAAKLGREPLAKIVGWAEIAGPDTSLHLKPAQAIRKLLEKQRLTLEDIDLFEINEAFASVVIASCRELGLSYDVVNVNGGAVAIGHPLAGTGFRLALTLAHELKRRGGGRGIASLCGGGGQGMALLIEVGKDE